MLEPGLREEGYALQVVSSLEYASALVSLQTFDLILAHLSADTPRQLLRAIKPLRGRIQAGKLGVVTGGKFSQEYAQEQGLAFILSRPLALEQLLAQIAICLRLPLTPEQERQAQVVERFLEALTLKERQKLLNLCAEDLVYYSLPSWPWPLAQAIRGKAALGIYLEVLRSRSHALRLEVQQVYSRPKGLLVQYSLWMAEADRSWRLISDAFLIQFSGDRIRQIGLQTDSN